MARNEASLNVSIVGAGRVGTALTLLLRNKGARIVSVISRRKVSARRLATLVGCRSYSQHVADLHPSTNFLLIATADEAISTVAQSIARSAPLNFSRLMAAHTSGWRTSDELSPLKRRGATTFSLHPIQTFPRHQALHQQLRLLQGISYGVEGPPAARRFARVLVTRLGGRMLEVPKDEKISYHLACVFASNYTIALLGAVQDLCKRVATLPHLRKLVTASVENAFDLTPQRALTGPIARGSVKTVHQHLAELRKKHQGVTNLYKAVGLYTVELTRRGHKLSPSTVRQLRKMLSQ